MPILFISLNKEFCDLATKAGYSAHVMNITHYVPVEGHKTYYVSPSNSLGFMDGGIDLALSHSVFPGVEPEVKQAIANIGIQSLLGRYYLPIGSSFILEKGSRALVIAPTMLLPQDIRCTDNVYYATMATLYNILVNKGESLETTDILFTSMGCGYGNLLEEESLFQILQGIQDYKIFYTPTTVAENLVIWEANLESQPRYYMNTEFLKISPREIIRQ
jgi:O-acetyl-ADP-ribose deacetylase (regulator of RNase III)